MHDYANLLKKNLKIGLVFKNLNKRDTPKSSRT